MSNNSGVYLITNLLNMKQYIGSAKSMTKRFAEHRAGRNSSPHLKLAIKKYGVENFQFDILEECLPENNLTTEQYFIDLFRPEYNIAPKAGSSFGVRLSAEQISARSGSGNHFFGKKHSEEWKTLMHEKMCGNTNGKGRKGGDFTAQANAFRKYWKNPENRKAAGERKRLWWQLKRSSND